MRHRLLPCPSIRRLLCSWLTLRAPRYSRTRPTAADDVCTHAVVPEILEPSLQLAAAVLGSLKMKNEEVSEVIDDFRRTHMSELSFLTKLSGGSLGYGFDTDHAGDSKGVEGNVDTVTLDLNGDDIDPMDDVILAQPTSSTELKGTGA